MLGEFEKRHEMQSKRLKPEATGDWTLIWMDQRTAQRHLVEG